MAKSPNRTTAPTGQIAPFGLRMLPELREQIEAAAKASGRSMNAEIVARLQQTFENNSTGGNLITMTMDEFDVFTESLISRALERAGHATKKRSSI